MDLFLQDEPKNPRPTAADGRVSVLVPYPVDKTYDYAVPQGMDLKSGDFVRIPLGKRQIDGVVWHDQTGDAPLSKLKFIIARHDIPCLPLNELKFLDWVAQYSLAIRGNVLKLGLAASGLFKIDKPVIGYKIANSVPSTISLPPTRQKIMEILKDGRTYRARDLSARAGVSANVLKTLVKAGLVVAVDMVRTPPCTHPDLNTQRVQLTHHQTSAAAELCESVTKKAFEVFLLDGVTGAGKTEVYFEAVAKAVEAGKQALILLPEIALSNAFLDRFQSRFGCAPALWHSDLSDSQRKSTWLGVARGETKVVVGARSALFLPFQALGVIVVDEEHDGAYKQEEGVMYHARDMAVVRAKFVSAPIILVSATPSLETMVNAWTGKYRHLKLPDRYGGARLPDIHTIDMRIDKPDRQKFIAPTLLREITATLEKGEQCLLFLNRRGYAPLTLCRNCGHRMNCPRCTSWLVDHRRTGKLHCHHCGYSISQPLACPHCQAQASFAACGPGVERIREEAHEFFPDAKICVLTSDIIETQKHLRDVLDDIRNHKVDIIIGTQIIAKGHHFPKLTLVGVIDADLGLSGGDLRASERTFQLLYQVAGRAGREDRPGRVYLQSFMPESKVIKALEAGDRDRFLEIEAGERDRASMPPYGRLAGIIVEGAHEGSTLDFARLIAKTAPMKDGFRTLGPAEAPLYKIRNKYRYRLLVQAEKQAPLQKEIQRWLENIKIPSGLDLKIDIDPQSFF